MSDTIQRNLLSLESPGPCPKAPSEVAMYCRLFGEKFLLPPVWFEERVSGCERFVKYSLAVPLPKCLSIFHKC